MLKIYSISFLPQSVIISLSFSGLRDHNRNFINLITYLFMFPVSKETKLKASSRKWQRKASIPT